MESIKNNKIVMWWRKNIHLILAVVWIALIPVALTVWQTSILFVILMSLYANIEASCAAREAAGDQDNIKKILKLLEENKREK